MKKIIFCFRGNKESTLIALENGKLIGDKVITEKKCRDYVMEKFNSLGDTFQEKWDYVVKHNADEKLRKQPFFWDDPLIVLIAEEVPDEE